MVAEQESQQEVILENGLWIDAETGEVLGVQEEGPGKPEFSVCDQGSLDWVMERMLAEEAKIHEIENIAIVVQARAILENAAKMKAERSKRLAWLHARFDTEIGEYVRPLLAGQKTKTHKTLFGSVAFRAKPGGLRIRDEGSAVLCLKAVCPEAVKVTESPRISLVPEEIRLAIASVLPAYEADAAYGKVSASIFRDGFEVAPDDETISVKTPVTP